MYGMLLRRWAESLSQLLIIHGKFPKILILENVRRKTDRVEIRELQFEILSCQTNES